ncbi:hypothetical protein ACOSP7_012269 [Xanthoceras sorbifolium]
MLPCSLLAHASMPLKYWDEAFLTSVFLINRMPTAVLQNRSPFEVLFHAKPDYINLKVFGCLCFPYLRPYNHHKLQYRSSPCTFLGYSGQHKGYRCLDAKGRIFITRHVVFDETRFPFAEAATAPVSSVVTPLVYPSLLPPITNRFSVSQHLMVSGFAAACGSSVSPVLASGSLASLPELVTTDSAASSL